jgi:hypothetical protein
VRSGDKETQKPSTTIPRKKGSEAAANAISFPAKKPMWRRGNLRNRSRFDFPEFSREVQRGEILHDGRFPRLEKKTSRQGSPVAEAGTAFDGFQASPAHRPRNFFKIPLLSDFRHPLSVSL